MSEFITVMNEYHRMCANNIRCDNCPLSAINNGNNGVSCQLSVCQSPEIAERIIMEWSKEHPFVTNRDKFKKVFGFSFDEKCAMPITVLEWLNEEYKGEEE